MPPPRSGQARSGPSPRPTTPRSPSVTRRSDGPSPGSAGPAAGTRSSSRSTRRAAWASSRTTPISIAAFVERFTQAGYDLEIVPPHYVPLALTLEICVEPEHFRPDVEEAVRSTLTSGLQTARSARLLPPRQLHIRPAALPEPAVRGRGRRRRGRLRGSDAVRAARRRRARDRRRDQRGEPRSGEIPDRLAGDRPPRRRPRLPRERPPPPASWWAASDGRRRHRQRDRLSGGDTPAVITNRPSLRAIEYRIGTYATFRRGCCGRSPDGAGHRNASRARPRRRPSRRVRWPSWTTRSADDFGIAFLEMWAYLGDILTFYQERIANEAFLRTTVRPQSTTLLVSLIGYRPGPGRAAIGPPRVRDGARRDGRAPRRTARPERAGPGREAPEVRGAQRRERAHASLNELRPQTHASASAAARRDPRRPGRHRPCHRARRLDGDRGQRTPERPRQRALGRPPRRGESRRTTTRAPRRSPGSKGSARRGGRDEGPSIPTRTRSSGCSGARPGRSATTRRTSALFRRTRRPGAGRRHELPAAGRRASDPALSRHGRIRGSSRTAGSPSSRAASTRTKTPSSRATTEYVELYPVVASMDTAHAAFLLSGKSTRVTLDRDQRRAVGEPQGQRAGGGPGPDGRRDRGPARAHRILPGPGHDGPDPV